MQDREQAFQFTIIQGKLRGRARIVRTSGAAAVIQTDRPLAAARPVMLVRDAGGAATTNRLVQIHGQVEKGDDEKLGYLVRFLHAQCPAGLETLLVFLQQELGLVTRDPAVLEALSDHRGPVTYRFDTSQFEMGGAGLERGHAAPVPSYRATPAVRRVGSPGAADAPEVSGEPSSPPPPGDPEELISMFGMKVRRDQYERLDEIVFRPGGSGQAVRSGSRDPASSEASSPGRRRTGLLRRMVRKLTSDKDDSDGKS